MFDVCPSVFVAAPSASPQMSRSTSTFSLTDSSKSSGAAVQRSNSLDHPPVRARVPVPVRVPCSPTDSPTPKPGSEFGPSLHPDHDRGSRSTHNAPKSPLLPKAQPGQSSSGQDQGLPLVRNPRLPQPKPSQQLSSAGCPSRLLVYRNLQVEPRRGERSSPHRETLL